MGSYDDVMIKNIFVQFIKFTKRIYQTNDKERRLSDKFSHS